MYSELNHLRIPFEKIKFGKKLEVEGYGSVLEGEIDGQRVALKQLNITNLGNIKPQLLAEILTISRFRHHPNLVALLGFCDEKNNEIILVFEYVASGNLEDKMRKRLTTIQRFEICLGAARGLDYLHTGGGVDSTGIVHGNIKLSKILLQSNSSASRFEAKVSSFGLSKIVPGKSQIEVAAVKESDVYWFGVVLLQVLCGVSEMVDTDDYQEHHVTQLVPKKMHQNKLQKVVHVSIRNEIKPEALETYAKIACQCVMEDPHLRPNMAQVVQQLEIALRLQGGEVTYVQIPSCINNQVVGANDDTVVEEEDAGSSGVTVELNIHGNHEPKDVSISTTKEDVKDSIAQHKLDVDGEPDKDDQVNFIGTVSDQSSNGQENTVEEDIITGGKVSDVQIFGGSSTQPEGETMSLNTTEEGSMVIEAETTEDRTEDVENPETREVNLKSNEEESKIIGENEVKYESEIITTPLSKSDNDDGRNSAMQGEKVYDAQFIANSNSSLLAGGEDTCEMTSLKIREEEESKVTTDDNTLEDNGNVPETKQEIVVDLKSNEESKINVENKQPENGVRLPEDAKANNNNGLINPHIMDVHNSSVIADGDDMKHGLLNTKKPEFIAVTMRGGDFSNSTQEYSESKRSAHSESSNGDDTTPSDYLLPDNAAAKKTSTPYSENCGCCICSCWQFIYDSLVILQGSFVRRAILE